MSPRPLLIVLLLSAVVTADHPKLAPWTGFRWTDDSVPVVEVEGQWRELREIDGLPVDRIVAFCRETHGNRWQKRIAEDLVQVLTEMGHPPGDSVRLVLRSPGGEDVVLEKTPLTAGNRRALMRRTYAPEVLDPATMQRTLEEFRAALDERWSYRRANDADFEGAIESLRAGLDAPMSPDRFGLELQRILALGIDGHSEVSGWRLPDGAFLPFLVEPEGDRFVAFRPDRDGFLAEGLPYVTRIDGKPVSEWCAAAEPLVPRGSPQYVRRHCLRQLRHLGYLRAVLGLPRKDTVAVELAAPGGAERREIVLPVGARVPTYGTWPRTRSQVLEGGIGYLRLESMDDEATHRIAQWMPRFRETRALVVDVRDNGGGSRDALRALYDWLAPPGAPPRVTNVAAYRRHPAHGEDHLAARFLYRADDQRWSDAERGAITALAETFRPEWDLPEGRFSAWHYFVLTRRESPGVDHYDRPVVVLMNAKCFSATDVFLASLKGLPNVTLLGTASGGGSARSRTVALPRTSLSVRLGTMASFRSDGRLFDGHGVDPDVVVEAAPEYHVGGRDNQLEEALDLVRER